MRKILIIAGTASLVLGIGTAAYAAGSSIPTQAGLSIAATATTAPSRSSTRRPGARARTIRLHSTGIRQGHQDQRDRKDRQGQQAHRDQQDRQDRLLRDRQGWT